MKRNSILFSFVLIGLASITSGHALASAHPRAPVHTSYTNGQQQEEPTPNQGDASLNWSGYVASEPNTTYTSVTGTWTVPTVAASSTNANTADATWVGIGGVANRDLIQAGTQAIVEGGQITYSAWIEMLPNYSTIIPIDVSSGDSITATITEESEGQWLITIANNTTGKVYSKTVAYDSSHSSAEWIEEMVSNGNGTFRPLDNFGSVTFSNAAATAGGTSKNLQELTAKPLNMVNGAHQSLANVSNGTDNGFTVSRTDALPTVEHPTPSLVRRHVPRGYSVVETIPMGFFTITIVQ